jgi:hypothetical protein
VAVSLFCCRNRCTVSMTGRSCIKCPSLTLWASWLHVRADVMAAAFLAGSFTCWPPLTRSRASGLWRNTGWHDPDCGHHVRFRCRLQCSAPVVPPSDRFSTPSSLIAAGFAGASVEFKRTPQTWMSFNWTTWTSSHTAVCHSRTLPWPWRHLSDTKVCIRHQRLETVCVTPSLPPRSRTMTPSTRCCADGTLEPETIARPYEPPDPWVISNGQSTSPWRLLVPL